MFSVFNEGKRITVNVNGQLFTKYHFSDVPKPFCWPIIGPNGKVLTRSFPIEIVSGETTDHPHHKGLWVGYGDINGFDLWTEKGFIVHRQFELIESNPNSARICARNDWCNPSGEKICEEIRDFRFYASSSSRIIDLTLTFLATEGDVTFGDTKEGFVALRLVDELTLKWGTGHILNANADENKNAWGKKAKWCIYYGELQGKPVCISFFDHPDNFGYPTVWHVRDYGLFANSPFGRKDFGLLPEDNSSIPQGQSLKLRYRFVFYSYLPTPKEVNADWNSFAMTIQP